MDSEKCIDLVAYLLCSCLEVKDKPRAFYAHTVLLCYLPGLVESQGFCRALSYIIQSMSSEFALGAKLHLPVRIAVPGKWAIAGTTGDFMVTVSLSIQYNPIQLKLHTTHPVNLVYLFHRGYHLRNSDLTIPSSHYHTLQHIPPPHATDHNIFGSTNLASYLVLLSTLSSCRRIAPASRVFCFGGVQQHYYAASPRKPKSSVCATQGAKRNRNTERLYTARGSTRRPETRGCCEGPG